ncbi:methionyl-tRNA formyltransferase [Salegentibacter sp. HM20]
MEKLRIVYMGTPDFAVAGLKEILAAGYEVAGVITAPDRPAGRGRKLQQSAVKQFALEKGLKVLQPTNLKDEGFLKELQDLNANLQVVVAFRMLPKQVWDMPKYGTFNLHASLLPQYRGAAPINWALIKGEEFTGVTTFFLDEKIDTGAIILQKQIAIEKEDSAGILHDKLMQLGARLILETIEQIERGEVKAKIQSHSEELKEAPKLNRDNTKIDWSRSVDEIVNHIRGLDPYPAAWTQLENKEKVVQVKLFSAKAKEDTHQELPGSIKIEEKQIKVAAKDGFVIIDEIQIPGKRKMPVKALLNGYEFENAARFF